MLEALIDLFLAAQFSNAVLAAQALQHDTNCILGGMMPACGSANIADRLFNAVRNALTGLSHRCFLTGYDESQKQGSRDHVDKQVWTTILNCRGKLYSRKR